MPEADTELEAAQTPPLEVAPDANDPAAQAANEPAAPDNTADPEAPAATAETAQSEPEKPAPAILSQMRPALAAHWNSFNAEQREAVLADLVEQLNASKGGAAGDGGGEDADPDGSAVPPKPATPTAAEALLGDMPADVTDAELDTLGSELGLSDTARASLRKLRDTARWGVQGVNTVGRRALEVAEVTDAAVKTSRAERDFEKAIESFGPTLSALDEATYVKVCQDAQALKASGEVRSYQRALQMAMLDNGLTSAPAPKSEPAPPNPAKIRREAVASSLGTPPRRAAAPRLPEVKNMDDLAEVARAEARRLGIPG
ncbi:MAG: hypothetical protein PHU85_11110 [Phycisphaerae bacterium]|nr:hypothetical protein [Phycisphaerae bacterium]